MSTPEDRLKETTTKELNELRILHNLQKRNAEQQKEYDRLYELYNQKILADPNILKEEPKEDYQLKATNKGFLKAITEAYTKQTGKEPVTTEQGVSLSFDSKEEAIDFFKKQAGEGHEFDAYCAAKDHRVYSDGKGTFVEGTMADVTAYLKDPKGFKLDENGGLSKKEPVETNISSLH